MLKVSLIVLYSQYSKVMADMLVIAQSNNCRDVIMPRCAHTQARYTVVCLCVCVASEVYGSVFVCLCVCVSVCVDCYSCSRINEVQVQVSILIGFYSHVFLDFNLWICKIMLRSRVMARFAYLECLFRAVRSETCPCSVATLLIS